MVYTSPDEYAPWPKHFAVFEQTGRKWMSEKYANQISDLHWNTKFPPALS